MKVRFLLLLSILLIPLLSCDNGFKLDDSEFRDIGDFLIPDNDFPTGVEKFTRNFYYPNFTDVIEETDSNTSFLKLTNVENEKTTLVVTLKLDGLVDNEFGNVKVTAEYSPLDSNSASFVKKMTFDRYDYMVLSKNLGTTEYDPSEASVEIILDTSVSPQAGYITFSFDYADSVYDQGEDFKEFTMFISAYGVNKPSFALADIVEKDDSIEYFKADKKIVLVDNTLEKSQESYTTTYTARFAGVNPEKPLSASMSSKTDGIEVGNFVNNDDGTINFDVTYNTKALMFEDTVDTFTLRLVPSAGSEDYYDNDFFEVAIEARRNKAFVFYKPSLSASSMIDKKSETIEGVTKYFTEITLPAQSTVSNPDVTYTLYRKDDRSAEFIKIADIPSPINSEVKYKDYDGLAITNAEQDYKVIISLNGESSLESDAVKGSRMLTEREMLIAAIETIRNSINKLHYTEDDWTGGFLKNDSRGGNVSGTYYHGITRNGFVSTNYRRFFSYNNYKDYFITLNGSFMRDNGGGSSSNNFFGYWKHYDTASGGFWPSHNDFPKTLVVLVSYGDAVVELRLDNIHIDNNKRNSPSWASGAFNINDKVFNKDALPIFGLTLETFEAWRDNIAPDGVYTQK